MLTYEEKDKLFIELLNFYGFKLILFHKMSLVSVNKIIFKKMYPITCKKSIR